MHLSRRWRNAGECRRTERYLWIFNHRWTWWISQNVLWIYGFVYFIIARRCHKQNYAKKKKNSENKSSRLFDAIILGISKEFLSLFAFRTRRRQKLHRFRLEWAKCAYLSFIKKTTDNNTLIRIRSTSMNYRRGNGEFDSTGNFDVNLTCSFAIRPKDNTPLRHGRHVLFHFIFGEDEDEEENANKVVLFLSGWRARTLNASMRLFSRYIVRDRLLLLFRLLVSWIAWENR